MKTGRRFSFLMTGLVVSCWVPPSAVFCFGYDHHSADATPLFQDNIRVCKVSLNILLIITKMHIFVPGV